MAVPAVEISNVSAQQIKYEQGAEISYNLVSYTSSTLLLILPFNLTIIERRKHGPSRERSLASHVACFLYFLVGAVLAVSRAHLSEKDGVSRSALGDGTKCPHLQTSTLPSAGTSTNY